MAKAVEKTTPAPWTKPSGASLKARSTSELVAATRSETDLPKLDALILREARAAINTGFIPDWSPEEFSDVLEKFRITLRDLPAWSISQAFAEWGRSRTHRPSPADIRHLGQEAMRPIADEIRRREIETDAAQEAQRPDHRIGKERADEILREAGFDRKRLELVKKFPRARTMEEAEQKEADPEKARHWAEKNPTPEQLAALQVSRDDNPLIQKAREMAECDEQAAPSERLKKRQSRG